MTVLELSLYLSLAIAVQLALLLSTILYRYQRSFRQLKAQLSGSPAGAEYLLEERPGNQTTTWQGWRDFEVRRKVFESRNKSICSLYLVPKDGKAVPSFRPGQFLTFRIPVADSAGENKEVVRCYSLSDMPRADVYRISVKRVSPPADHPESPPGLLSNHLHDHVHEGDVLLAKAPSGHFYLDDTDTSSVFIAGGIGITPMLSMLSASLESNPSREIWLFYGLKNSDEHMVKEDLEKLAMEYSSFHLRISYSQPLPDDVLGSDYQYEGRIDLALLRMTLSRKPYQFYVCGPGPMMEHLVPALEEWGVPEQHIHYEAFGPASLSRPAQQGHSESAEDVPLEKSTVIFTKSGQSLAWDGSALSLLELAEANGIKIDSGCRAGGCGSCETVIVAGEVEYMQAPDFDPSPGSCLLCIARPKRYLELEA